MRVLVTGGAGYVGSATARHLLARGHEVVVLDDLRAGHREAVPAERLVVGALADADCVGRVLTDHAVEAVLHFAASCAVGESVADPGLYYRNNVAGSLGLLEALRAHGIRRLVFSSTCAVYGESHTGPLHEDLPPAPTSPYAFTKHVIERMIADFARAYGLGHALLRYFNAAGASAGGAHGEDHRPETHLIPLALRAAQGGGTLEVYGNDYPTPDGSCVRDYVHVDDLAAAHELALHACPDPHAEESGRVFNLGTGRGHSVLEVIGCVERVTGRRVAHRVGPRRPGDAPELVARAELARRELGWEPRYTKLDPIVASAWEWHRTHPDGYGA